MIDLLTNNWESIATVLVGVLLTGKSIAKLTENKIDNKVFNALHTVGKALDLDFKKLK